MALRKIMYYDKDDILRKKSLAVEKIDDEILTLLKDMSDTIHSSNAFGLSAVQIGVLKRIIVLKDGTSLIYLINPVIIKEFGKQIAMEGCLSLPGIRRKVKRPYLVFVKAINDRGEMVAMEFKGFLARVVCHEIDHLDGVLFIDKAFSGT